MTQEQKRIKIAEACGLGLKQEEGQRYKSITDMLERSYTTLEELEIPDYFNDLNAMHEAEKMLRDNMTYVQRHAWNRYCEHLGFFLRPQNVWDNNCIHADSTQRAEAFGRTLGLWTSE